MIKQRLPRPIIVNGVGQGGLKFKFTQFQDRIRAKAAIHEFRFNNQKSYPIFYTHSFPQGKYIENVKMVVCPFSPFNK